MFNFPKISAIRFPKLIFHSILLTVILTLIALFGADLAGWVLEKPVEMNEWIITLLVIIWIFFALQSEKYRKQDS